MELTKLGNKTYELLLTPPETEAVRKAITLWAGQEYIDDSPGAHALLRMTAGLDKLASHQPITIRGVDPPSIESLGRVLVDYQQHRARYVERINEVLQGGQDSEISNQSEFAIAMRTGQAAGTLALDLDAALYAAEHPVPDHVPADLNDSTG